MIASSCRASPLHDHSIAALVAAWKCNCAQISNLSVRVPFGNAYAETRLDACRRLPCDLTCSEGSRVGGPRQVGEGDLSDELVVLAIAL